MHVSVEEFGKSKRSCNGFWGQVGGKGNQEEACVNNTEYGEQIEERSSGLQSLPGRIELGFKERLCNGNDGKAAAFGGCQISAAEDLEEQIRSSFGKNDIL
ncbi:hypothetical protein BTVI_60934 [Pitangus sulphuratus]|nr:hypothetical protein BTVI_60934 [Pitangus sulphuratus]